MKKIITIALALVMILPLAIIGVSAETTAPKTLNHVRPDWLITEVLCDTKGDSSVEFGYADNKDPFEAIEIYNNSGKTLNLYDYCLTYNGDGMTSANFQTRITETTPFLTNNTWEDKPGNYIDQSTKTSDQMPTNPQDGSVEAGEVVVIWLMYFEAYLDYTGGTGKTGLSIENFRSFNKVPDNVKVFAADGNSNGDIENGGHDKNFNVKNSGTGTYGLALYSEDLNSKTNVLQSTYDLEGGYRGTASPMSAWVSVDYANFCATSVGNLSINFGYDFNGHSSDFYSFDFDSRNMQYQECLCELTLGTLTDLQKITNPWYEYKVGEEITLPDLSAGLGIPDYTDKSTFTGWTVDGGTTELEANTKYTVAASGTHTFTPVYVAPVETTAPVTTAAPKPTTTPAPASTTANPAASTTAAKADASTTAAPAKSSGGCGNSGAVIAIAELIMVIGTAVTFAVIKKK